LQETRLPSACRVSFWERPQRPGVFFTMALSGKNMLSGQRVERGKRKLPASSWAISILTCIILLLAIATALA
jgi:hypothetical protein